MPSPKAAPASRRRRSLLALGATGAALALLGCIQGNDLEPPADAPSPSATDNTRAIEITQADIDWFRRGRAEWIDCESGAPAIIPADMSLDEFGYALDGGDSPAFDRFVNITTAFFLHATFTSDTYSFEPPLEDCAAITVTPEHIRLLQRANWRSFVIDCKRPYGDFTHFEVDMATLLGVPVTHNAKGEAEIGDDQEARMDTLHSELLFVLQAYIRYARLGAGRYVVPEREIALSYARPLCRPVSDARVAAYQRAEKAALADPDAIRKSVLREVAAVMFTPSD